MSFLRSIALAALLVLGSPCTGAAEAADAGPTRLPIRLLIHPDQPAYAGMPLWLRVEPGSPGLVAYPFSDDPADFGSNLIELKRDTQLLQRRSAFRGQIARVGPVGQFGSSIAPQGAPANRLPLHIAYTLDQPGHYAVRWTQLRDDWIAGVLVKTVAAQSDWVEFDIRPSTPQRRTAWLQHQLATAPAGNGELVGDYLPDLLAGAPDPRVLQALLQRVFAAPDVVQSYAMGSVWLFPDPLLRSQLMATATRRGPVESLVYMLSATGPLSPEDKATVINLTLPYLHSTQDWQTRAALRTLEFLAHDRRQFSPAAAVADQAVLDAAPQLMERKDGVAGELATYLGEMHSDASRETLWRIARSPGQAREQALIALCWIGDRRDLAPLGDLLWQPGDVDARGADLSHLPYHLLRAYHGDATPFVRRALNESPYVWVRVQAAEQLVQQGDAEGFRFCRDALLQQEFYKQEIIQWLRDRFPREMAGKRDDADIIDFLNRRLLPA